MSKVGDYLTCIKDAPLLKKGNKYKLLVIVNNGADFLEEDCSGYIVELDKNNPTYPYIWDKNRFVKEKD